jgi:hypothetical protein
MSHLTNCDFARAALEKAHTLDEVESICDKAEALRVYAKQAPDVICRIGLRRFGFAPSFGAQPRGELECQIK